MKTMTPRQIGGLPVTGAALRPRVGDLRQVASVRRIVLDDGPERGVRALAFSTGGGLDFWVLADRSLDIGPAQWRGLPFAWQGPNGFRAPTLLDAEESGGRGFERGVGGLLVTCGLEHIRQPTADHPLHGRLPFTPARVTAYGEDWDREEPVLFCEGEITEARLGGVRLRLHRRIEAPIGGAEIRIEDRVENLSAEPCPQAILYHVNFGFPALQERNLVRLGGHAVWGPFPAVEAAARPATCLGLQPGPAECSLVNEAGLAWRVGFDAAALPYLQLWRDLRPGIGLLSVEPCNTGVLEPGQSAPAPPLGPFASRTYRLTVSVESAAD